MFLDTNSTCKGLNVYHFCRCEEEDKFVLIYTLCKLGLIRGKSIIFVNTVDKGYR